jgi:hypothetical protein
MMQREWIPSSGQTCCGGEARVFDVDWYALPANGATEIVAAVEWFCDYDYLRPLSLICECDGMSANDASVLLAARDLAGLFSALKVEVIDRLQLQQMRRRIVAHVEKFIVWLLLCDALLLGSAEARRSSEAASCSLRRRRRRATSSDEV